MVREISNNSNNNNDLMVKTVNTVNTVHDMSSHDQYSSQGVGIVLIITVCIMLTV